MDAKPLKLLNRNFTIMVIGQIISIFGSALIRFALPLHILNLTGSASTFGITLGISVLPTIILSPISGIMADRMNKRNIMVVLDFITTVIIALLGIAFTHQHSVVAMGIVLLFLAAIQSLYQPAVQSSVPFLASEKNLVRANAMVNQVSSLSGLLGPIVGGVVYGFWGIKPIIIAGVISFFCSAVMELFLHIPFERRLSDKSIFAIAKEDFGDSIHFLVTKPILIQCAILISSFNLLFDSMIIIGIPYIIINQMGLGSQFYGIAQGSLSAGALCGGIVISILFAKVKMNKTYILFGSTIIAIAPIALVLWLGVPTVVTYWIIVVCCFIFMAICTMFDILMLTFVQRETPPMMIGKVIAYVLALCSISRPIGQAVYGILFERFAGSPYVIIFTTMLINIFITFYAKHTLSRIKN